MPSGRECRACRKSGKWAVEFVVNPLSSQEQGRSAFGFSDESDEISLAIRHLSSGVAGFWCFAFGGE